MKSLILKSYEIAHKRKWDKLYWAIDIHDCILEANYKSGGIPTTFLSNAKEVLQRLTQRKDCVLILYTCSFPHEITQYLEFFKENGIVFKHVNENPDAPNTAFGCFDKKFYYNILIEDKAGFDHTTGWHEVNEALDIIDRAMIVEVAKCSKPAYWYNSQVGTQHLVVATNFDPETNLIGIHGSLLFAKEDCKHFGKFDLTLNATR